MNILDVQTRSIVETPTSNYINMNIVILLKSLLKEMNVMFFGAHRCNVGVWKMLTLFIYINALNLFIKNYSTSKINGIQSMQKCILPLKPWTWKRSIFGVCNYGVSLLFSNNSTLVTYRDEIFCRPPLFKIFIISFFEVALWRVTISCCYILALFYTKNDEYIGASGEYCNTRSICIKAWDVDETQWNTIY